MPISNRLSSATDSYDAFNESSFRREVQGTIGRLEREIEGLKSGRSNEFAKAVRREDLLIPEHGVVEYPNDAAYCSARVTVPATGTSCPAGLTYATAVSSWTEDHANDWGESSGEFTYTGNSTRRFLVTWTIFCLYSNLNTQITLIGKVRKKPSGGSFADVAGSEQRTSFDPYLVYFTSYFFKHLSGSTIVEVSNGDSIQLLYGFWNLQATTRTITVLSGYGEAMNINIVPADNLP